MPRIHHSFADLLHSAKTRRRLTNSGLAKALSISIKTLEQWLAGDRSPLAITQEGALARLSGETAPGVTEEFMRGEYAAFMLALGMNQNDFANALGVTEETIAMRLGGALPITLEAMMAVHGLAALICGNAEEAATA